MPLFGSRPPEVEKLEARRDVKGLIGALRYPKEGKLRIAAAEGLGKIGDARAVEPLIKALEDSDRLVRSAAAWALSAIGDARAVGPLISALNDVNEYVRKAAAKALGKIGDVQAVEPLIKALNDWEGEVILVCDSAEDALVQIGAAAVEPLISALKESEGPPRNLVAEALGNIGDARAVEPLINILKDGSEGPSSSAAEALGRIGDARAVEPLVKALKDRHQRVRSSAASALNELGWKPGKDEAGAAYFVIFGRWDKCVQIGAEAVGPLVAALGNNREDDCKAAAKALGEIGDARAVAPLMAALSNSPSEVIREIEVALRNIGTPDAERGLREEEEKRQKQQEQEQKRQKQQEQKQKQQELERKQQEHQERESELQAMHQIEHMTTEQMVAELIKIGRNEGFLSMRPGGEFDNRMRHIRAQAIGRRLDEIGGFALMQKVGLQVAEAFGPGSHQGRELEVAWGGIGSWRG